MSFREAKDKAEKWLSSQAALHNPDQIAGGNPMNVPVLCESAAGVAE